MPSDTERQRATHSSGSAALARIQLRRAASVGDCGLLTQLLDSGVDINTHVDLSGTTALVCAIESGQYHAARMLIERGASVGPTAEGMLPLVVAARGGDLQTCKALLAAGALIDACDKTGRNALYTAAGHSRPPICELLIQFGADVNRETEFGLTALHAACERGGANPAKVVRILVAGGADPSKISSRGRDRKKALSAFQLAVLRGRADHVKYFLQQCGQDPMQKTLDGKSMLELAESPVVQTLLRSAMIERGVLVAIDPVPDTQELGLRAKEPSPL